MGNQLTGEAPVAIYPVEHYFTDIPNYTFDCSLGSTRFFKVARARYKEGLVVVRIFVIQDPTVPLPLKEHQDRLDVIFKSLKNLPNCLPFQSHLKLDRAAFLIRQYVKYSLYDRLSTRPFLTLIEKKWIAFQLLCALNQCHKVQVCHGDIKAENILITGWIWVTLTDFASFKPVSLPYDNPADFSYFFDTSRRRVCYIAPERFTGRPPSNGHSDNGSGLEDSHAQKVYKELTPAMDIFSAGCVIIELFCDGTPPFDLSQLLNYSSKNYSPWKLIDTIPDNNIKDLVEHMTQRKPEIRLSAEEYLIKQRGKAFPEYFYTFFKSYAQQFATLPVMPSDDWVLILNRDMDTILAGMDVDERPEKNSKLVLVISLVTSVVRDLHFSNFRIIALKLLLRLSNHVTSDIILDRILPYMLYFTQDTLPEVRAETIRVVTACIRNLKTVPRNDANVFQDYIIPALVESNYDMELQQLKDLIHQKIFQLLSDSNNAVKMTLMANGMDKLCLFFGRQKANDILLSHIVTFLNVKDDWRLRACFFKTVVDVTMYVGWQCSEVLLPLLQQGLSDTEEFVIAEDLYALKQLTTHRLLTKTMMQTLVCEATPLLAHPGPWVRQAAVGFITAVAGAYDIPDLHCKLLPQLKPFLRRSVMQLRKPMVLIDALGEPVPREVFDYLLRSPQLEHVFDVFTKQIYIRNLSRQPRTVYPELDERLSQVFRKLTSLGLTEKSEGKLLVGLCVFVLVRLFSDQFSHQSLWNFICPQNPEWKKMFGNDEPDTNSLSSSPKSGTVVSSPAPATDQRKLEMSLKNLAGSISPTPVITRYAKCKWELRDLVHHRRAQFEADILSTDAISAVPWDGSHVPESWKPKGVLVAHLQEHRGAVNRQVYCVLLSADISSGKIKCVTFLERSTAVASVSDNNSLHVYRLDSGSVKLEDAQVVDMDTYGQVMDMTHFDSGAQSVLTYTTVSSHIIGWDLRSSSPAWMLRNDPRQGLVTSLAVNRSQCWLAVGTCTGVVQCWDMRFRMPINKIQHPSYRRSWLVASFNWNNEVTMLDAETGQRQKTLWPSPSPPLSYSKQNKSREDEGVCGVYVGATESKTFVLTGGTDMRLRYWDLNYPANSTCFSYGLDNPRSLSFYYRAQLIEGCEVIQELESPREPLDKNEAEREIHMLHSSPLHGHHDIINDITLCHSTQALVVSAARNGHIKVWK
ncbi:unnamed protein product [Candidula unifasciata]|uniref:non-specific serine/threonine protein kinase n=1 Tax=Candidula unifasciata TaxID=100452 RepID=A0A8S4A7I9_9EUPU|nr:unnamed protein product [Candidula unifasciata]